MKLRNLYRLIALISFCLFYLFQPVHSYSQSLSETEQDIIDDVERNYEETLDLLRETVDINSGTFNLEGVKKVADVFDREFRSIGFETEWIPLPDEMNRAGHFVATRKGNSGKKLLLIGHLDTVFEESMPFTPFTVINDSTAVGQGVNDMKGGNVMIFAALKALHENDLLADTHITVYFTGDEENSGDPKSVSRGDFVERAKDAEIALGFETSQGFNIATTARRGSSSWRLKVSGRQAHSSGIFKERTGYGAIYEAARILNQFREDLTGEQYLTFNPGQIVGGSDITYDEKNGRGTSVGKTNIVAKDALVTGDLRFLGEDQKEYARQRMREIVSQNLNQTSALITFEDGIPSMPPTDGNDAVLEVLNGASQDLGYGEVVAGDPGSRGAADISFVADYVDAIDGIGASGSGAHSPDETINLNDYPDLIKRSALFIYRLTR